MQGKVLRGVWTMGLLLALVAAPLASLAASEPVRVGVVDLQRCLNQSKMGKKLKAQFAAEMEQVKEELTAEDEALKALAAELEKQAMVLSETAMAERRKEVEDRQEAFREKFRNSQQAVQRRDQELTATVLKGLRGIIRGLGEKEGYALILEQQEGGVLYMVDTVDLTAEVIRRYDASIAEEPAQ